MIVRIAFVCANLHKNMDAQQRIEINEILKDKEKHLRCEGPEKQINAKKLKLLIIEIVIEMLLKLFTL